VFSEALSEFVRRDGPMADRLAGPPSGHHGGLGVAQRLGAGQDVLGVVRDLVDQRVPGDSGDIRRVNDRTTTAAKLSTRAWSCGRGRRAESRACPPAPRKSWNTPFLANSSRRI
jgi:hypothetical protein